VDSDGAEEWNVIRIQVEAAAAVAAALNDWDPSLV
jgi:hypothetical protein